MVLAEMPKPRLHLEGRGVQTSMILARTVKTSKATLHSPQHPATTLHHALLIAARRTMAGERAACWLILSILSLKNLRSTGLCTGCSGFRHHLACMCNNHWNHFQTTRTSKVEDGEPCDQGLDREFKIRSESQIYSCTAIDRAA